MPLYNTATVATALQVAPKWLDNLLSHNELAGLHSDSQGVSRRLPLATVIAIALAKELIETLDLSASTAVRIAEDLLRDDNGELTMSPHIRLEVPLDTLRASVMDQLSHAVETAPTPRRGRPPKR